MFSQFIKSSHYSASYNFNWNPPLGMRMLKVPLFIFLIVFVRDTSCAIDALYDAGRRVWDLYSVLNQTNLAIISNPKTVGELLGNGYEANQKMTSDMYDINAELDAIEVSINPKIFSILLQFVNSNAVIVKWTDEMEIFVKSINDDYQEFYRMIAAVYVPNRPINHVTPVFLNIQSNIRMIRKIMTAEDLLPNDKNLITAITRHIAIDRETLCGDMQPIAEILVQLFKIAIITEIKISLMSLSANKQRFTENQEWKAANDFSMMQFQRYFGSYVTILKENLGRIESLYVRACDPDRGIWILYENAYELDGTMQSAIFQYDWTKCGFDFCEDMWRQEKRSQCDAGFHDERSGCADVLGECQKLDGVKACVLKNGPHKFQYVNSTALGLLGRKSECLEDEGYIIDNRNSKYRTCACDCKGNHYKISSVLMESSVNSNDVITGLRFKCKNKILFIQPRVEKLETNGYIQQKSDRWLAIPKDTKAFHIRDMGIEEITFFLDDLRLPAGFALTGVKFTKAKRGFLEGFAIEICGIPFDYRSGKLDYSGKINLVASPGDAGKPVVFDPISSFQTKLRHTPTPGDRMYIKLKRSLLENDFGQSTLPLFDAVPIRTDPPSALAGISIFHKGVEDYAGFISLRAHGIEYTEYFENFTSAHIIEGQVQLFI